MATLPNLKAILKAIAAKEVVPLGTVSMVPMDAWVADKQYNKLNYVRHNSATYLAKKANIGVEPGVAENWEESWMLSTYDGNIVTPNGTYPAMTVGAISSTQLTIEDLNNFMDLTSAGKSFYGAAGNTVQNKPANVDAFHMDVVQADDNTVLQIIRDTATDDLYVRNGANKQWKQFALVDGTYSGLTAGKAISDGEGNNIFNTYETKVASASAIQSEAQARANADSELSQKISSEVSARETADAGLSDRISVEVSARETADTALGNRISDIVAGTTEVGKAQSATSATNDKNGNDITTFYAHNLSFSIDSSTYVLTIKMYDGNGDTLISQNVDLPLETVVVNGSYNEETKEVVLTLQNGSTISFSVADLVDGLASQAALNDEISARAAADLALQNAINAETARAKLAENNNATAASNAQATANSKYTKPEGGIPASDLSQSVQDSLAKANSAVQESPVVSVAGKVGAVLLNSSDVGLGNVDNIKQYSVSNPPPYPVTSVNGKTGAVVLSASDVGAASTAELSSEATTRQNADASLAAVLTNITNGTTPVGIAETAQKTAGTLTVVNGETSETFNGSEDKTINISSGGGGKTYYRHYITFTNTEISYEYRSFKGNTDGSVTSSQGFARISVYLIIYSSSAAEMSKSQISQFLNSKIGKKPYPITVEIGGDMGYGSIRYYNMNSPLDFNYVQPEGDRINFHDNPTNLNDSAWTVTDDVTEL